MKWLDLFVFQFRAEGPETYFFLAGRLDCNLKLCLGKLTQKSRSR